MDVDQDPAGRDTPPGTFFEDGYTPPTSRGQHAAAPPAHIPTRNFFTPLSTEPQDTDLATAAVAGVSAMATAAAQATMDETEAEAAEADAAQFIASLAT